MLTDRLTKTQKDRQADRQTDKKDRLANYID